MLRLDGLAGFRVRIELIGHRIRLRGRDRWQISATSKIGSDCLPVYADDGGDGARAHALRSKVAREFDALVTI